jgi:microcystin-dependent protein
MADPFVAEVRIFPFNFPPTGWAFCNGQLLPLSQNTALFALIGTFYGGDGKSTFALPNLQGNAAMHQGQGQGLSQHFIGEQSGSEQITLLTSEIPFHTHNLQASGAEATTATAAGHMPAMGLYDSGLQNGLIGAYSAEATPNTQMGPQAISVAGGGLPHNNMQPYLTLNFCIALQGVFPPRP